MTEDEMKTYVVPFSKMKADVKYKHDTEKINYLKSLGYKVFIIWSNKDLDEQLEKAKKFIYDSHR